MKIDIQLSNVTINMQPVLVLAALLGVVAIVQSASSGARNPVAAKTLVLATKCVKDNDLPAEKSKLAFNQEIPKDDAERCFLDCVYRGHEIVAGNKFNLEGAMKTVNLRFQVPDEISLATKLVETCDKEVKANDGEKCSLGRAVRECFVKNGKEVDFFPSAI